MFVYKEKKIDDTCISYIYMYIYIYLIVKYISDLKSTISFIFTTYSKQFSTLSGIVFSVLCHICIFALVGELVSFILHFFRHVLDLYRWRVGQAHGTLSVKNIVSEDMDRMYWDKPKTKYIPDSKGHGANMGPIWGRQNPSGPHVGAMNIAIWAYILGVCGALWIEVAYLTKEVKFRLP